MKEIWAKATWNGAEIEQIKTNSRQEWLSVRNGLEGIGGSEIGTVLGLDSYKSRIRLFYEKVGLVQANWTDNIYAFMGRMLEDKIVELYEAYDEDEAVMMFNHSNGIKTRKVEIVKDIMRVPSLPNLFMNIDGKVVEHPEQSTPGILECKMVSGVVAGKWKLGFPIKYVAQAQQYMLLPNTEWADLAQITDGVKFVVTHIPRSDSLQDKLVTMADDFMARVRKAKEICANTKGKDKQLQYISAVEPPYEDVFDYGQFLSEKHLERTNMVSSTAPEQVQDLVKKIQAAQSRIDLLQQFVLTSTNQLKKQMEDEGLKEWKLQNGYVRWLKRFVIKSK